ncbi:tetratricopeptide repeat protein [Microbacteriaceae bacterium K1510]|nr:tetratricopeptide repeat protein [Microbacteriaceae bacterium K1510]
MTSSSLGRYFAGTALAALLAAAPIELVAQPSDQDLIGLTASGSYLAARHAGQMRDAAAAAAYYRVALNRDPKNGELLDRTFLSLLVGGNIDDAVKYADQVAAADKSDRVARLVLGVNALKKKQYVVARRELAQSVRGPITDLTATLLSSWAQFGAKDAKGAVAAIDRLAGPDWYAIFKDLHAGLILDLAGNEKEAGKRFERAYKADSSALRVVEAYGSWVSRNKSPQEALAIYEAFDKVLPRHPLIVDAMTKLKAGEKLPILISSAQAGAAEALYGLGASLGRRGGEDLGLVYLQLGLHLAPNHPLALLSLADLYESLKKPELAIKAYERIPASSPLHRNAEIQMAANLDTLERADEAEKHLQALIKRKPDDIEAIMALGNVLRGHKKFAECADVYSKGVDLIPNPEKANWVIFYFRGICYERSKQWPKSEADLKKALELYPDQPHVLNYLGYSWIDQGVNLDDGMAMIRKAVQQRPDDGYIVDSLGWAYYRIGNYDEAVKQLERAIELKPEDPTINDHLGDAYWRVGRELEARFQWAHARDLKPEPEELPKIEEKLKNGLAPESANQAKAAKKTGDGG